MEWLCGLCRPSLPTESQGFFISELRGSSNQRGSPSSSKYSGTPHSWAVLKKQLSARDPVPPAAPGHWLEMKIPRPHPRPREFPGPTPDLGNQKLGGGAQLSKKPSGAHACLGTALSGH